MSKINLCEHVNCSQIIKDEDIDNGNAGTCTECGVILCAEHADEELESCDDCGADVCSICRDYCEDHDKVYHNGCSCEECDFLEATATLDI